jgi:hypothetical protein
MNGSMSIVEEINRRILELKTMEEEYKKKNNVSGRLNAKTRREELQRLKNLVLAEEWALPPKAALNFETPPEYLTGQPEHS